MCVLSCLFLLFKQMTEYEMRISDWSSDVCSSDLISINAAKATISGLEIETGFHPNDRLNLNASFSTFFKAQYDEFPACLIYRPNGAGQTGRASCRERVGQYE